MNEELIPDKDTDNEKAQITEQPSHEQETSAQAEEVTVGKGKAKSLTKKQLIVVISVLVIVAGSAGAAYGLHLFGLGKKSAVPKPSTSSSSTAPLTPVVEDFTPVKQADGSFKISNRTWLAKPEKLDLSKYLVLAQSSLFSDGVDEAGKKTSEPNFDIYRVGKTDKEDILEVFGNTLDGGNALFLSNNGSFKLLKKMSEGSYDQDGKLYYDLGSKTTEDTSTDFPELHVPDKLTLNGKAFFATGKKYALFDATTGSNGFVSYAQTNYGTVYKETKGKLSESVSFISAQGYSVATYAFTSVTFLPNPDARDKKSGEVSFSDGTKNISEYGNGFHGCALGGTFHDIVTDKSLQYQEAGKLSDGTIIYALKAGTQRTQLVNSLVTGYNDFYSTDTPPKSLTNAQMEAKKPFFMYKTALDEYAVIYNLDIIPVGGCGKPVVYLYPTQKTNVSVKVDADIRVSEPAYNSGWNVTAFPNGSLVNSDGKMYSSLFWEGYGQSYPDVTEGVVVPTTAVAQKLSQQLVQLGLNKTEQNDFLAYWLPKMPSTPYVRLTWFGTSQVNKLAPLHVSPAPDTLIRVFLDYEGLSAPGALKPQVLTAKPRNGFTVVEWGGLLHGKLPAK